MTPRGAHLADGRWACCMRAIGPRAGSGINARPQTRLPAPAGKSLLSPPLPCFRKSFTIDRPVSRARSMPPRGRLCAAHQRQARGRRLFQSRLVGLPQAGLLQRLRRHRPASGEGQRPRRRAGGWLVLRIYLGGPQQYGQEPRLMVQLQIEYADGTKQTLGTDGPGNGHTDRGSKAIPNRAKRTTPGWRCPAGIRPPLTISSGRRGCGRLSRWVPCEDRGHAQRGGPPAAGVATHQDDGTSQRSLHFQPGPEHRGLGPVEGQGPGGNEVTMRRGDAQSRRDPVHDYSAERPRRGHVHCQRD